MKTTTMMIQTLVCDLHQKGMAFDHREAMPGPIRAEGYGGTHYTTVAFDHYTCPMGCAITVASRDIEAHDMPNWKTRIRQPEEGESYVR